MFGNNHSVFADLIALELLKEIRNELKKRDETKNNQKTETKTEATEESKWVGCFCRFWDRENEGKLFPFYGTLVGITDKCGSCKYLCGLAGNKDNPNKEYVPFRFCEPVKPEEIKFFTPEVKKDESNNS